MNKSLLSLSAALMLAGVGSVMAQPPQGAAAPGASPPGTAVPPGGGPPPAGGPPGGPPGGGPPFVQLPYGSPISLADARMAAAAAVSEAKRRGLNATVAVVDQAGVLIYFEKDPKAYYASEDVAILGAKGAARFGHGSDNWERQVESGDLAVLFLPGPVYQGGGSQVIVRDKKIIGAIAVAANAGSATDADISKIGAAAIK